MALGSRRRHYCNSVPSWYVTGIGRCLHDEAAEVLIVLSMTGLGDLWHFFTQIPRLSVTAKAALSRAGHSVICPCHDEAFQSAQTQQQCRDPHATNG